MAILEAFEGSASVKAAHVELKTLKQTFCSEKGDFKTSEITQGILQSLLMTLKWITP